MCGLGVIYGQRGPLVADALRSNLDAMSATLAHRGPDGSATWIDPSGAIGLCHTRLSVIDLETGAQPIANEDGSLHLIANGEFYDYQRIRRDLESRGHRFRTQSDTEIALHLYEEMGTSCLTHLRGEFALVLWDAKRRSLFAARDRFGIKPFFFAEIGNGLVMASEAKALFAAGVEAAWDPSAVHRTLFMALDQNESLFRGVRQLPTGSYLVADSSGTKITRYWSVDYPKAQSTSMHSADEWVEIARDRMNEAVRLRLVADVPVGCLLSGGLDSSATLGMASASLGRPITAFTVAFDDPAFDESPRARDTAARHRAEFHCVPVSATDVADHFSDAVWRGEMVQYNAHGVARYLLSREVKRAGYKVVLAGEGGDELFAGYHFCSAALESNGRRRLPPWLRSILRMAQRRSEPERTIARTSPWLARALGVMRFPAHLVDALGAKVSVLHSLLEDDFRDAVSDPYGSLFQSLQPTSLIKGREPVKQILYLWTQTIFPNYVLAGERLDMAHSVEVRLPLLDHELFDIVKEIPASILARGGLQKWVLREAARPYITDDVHGAVKRGFLAPAWTRAPGPLHEFIEDTLRSTTTASLPFFRRRALVELMDDWRHASDARRASLDAILLMVASLSVLQERFRL